MNPVGAAKLAAAVLKVAVAIDEDTDKQGREYKRVYVLGIPVFDTRWEGVRRRRARRAERRDRR